MLVVQGALRVKKTTKNHHKDSVLVTEGDYSQGSNLTTDICCSPVSPLAVTTSSVLQTAGQQTLPAHYQGVDISLYKKQLNTVVTRSKSVQDGLHINKNIAHPVHETSQDHLNSCKMLLKPQRIDTQVRATRLGITSYPGDPHKIDSVYPPWVKGDKTNTDSIIYKANPPASDVSCPASEGNNKQTPIATCQHTVNKSEQKSKSEKTGSDGSTIENHTPSGFSSPKKRQAQAGNINFHSTRNTYNAILDISVSIPPQLTAPLEMDASVYTGDRLVETEPTHNTLPASHLDSSSLVASYIGKMAGTTDLYTNHPDVEPSTPPEGITR